MNLKCDDSAQSFQSLRRCPLPADKAELRAHLKKFASQPYVEALADFHLLLWLAAQPQFDLGSEIAQLAGAVKEKHEVPEGYKLIIQALAES